jgi:hypothetical protein
MQTSVGTSIVRGSPTTSRNSALEIPTTENPVLEVAAGGCAGYIDKVTTVRRSDRGLRRTNGCTADREFALLKW